MDGPVDCQERKVKKFLQEALKLINKLSVHAGDFKLS
jgi:hypothetical protein